MNSVSDAALRVRIFDDLARLAMEHHAFIPRDALLNYAVDGDRLPLIDYSRGIRNPRQLEATLSVVSSLDGPYSDHSPMEGVWRYDYRAGTTAGDNTKLRRAQELGVDIVLFLKRTPGEYQPIFPVRVVEDNPVEGYVILALAEIAEIGIREAPSAVERHWAEVITRKRVHQPAFRKIVLTAYNTQCTVCRFRHAELLDAAHIIRDSEDWGEAVVTNGMSMCKIHHAAYDRDFLGIDPDYRIHINQDLLDEVDGPMLQHGLKDMHGQRIVEPTRTVDQPDRDRLASRFKEFQSA